MRALRILTGLAVVATLTWCGYWFVGARALDRVLAEGLSRLPQVSVAGHSISGFPNRFDITLDEPRLTQGDVEWSSSFVQVFALSYRLNHLIAVFAPEQLLRIGQTEALLQTDALRASVVMEAGRDLPLSEAVLIGTGLTLRTEDAHYRVDALRLASRRTGDRVHEVALVLDTVFPDAATLRRLDPTGDWPRRFDALRLDGAVEFDRPLDRHALQGSPPQVARVTLTGARIAWEGVDIGLTGRLIPDALGVLSGDMTLRVQGWQALTAHARASGLLDEGTTGLLGRIIEAVPTDAGGDQIEVPMAVVAGDVWIGPLLLGTLPALP